MQIKLTQDGSIQIMKQINKLSMLLVVICLLVSSSFSNDIHTQSKHLSQYSELHNSRFNLVALTDVIQSKSSHQGEAVIQLFLHNSVQYIQLCYDQQAQNITEFIPYFARQRSYQPIDRNNLAIRCYNIFNKLELMQEPLPLPQKRDTESRRQKQQQQVEQQQNGDQTTAGDKKDKKKQSKQIEYLNNEYQLIKWLHDVYVGVNQRLASLSGKLGGKVALQGLYKFSLNLNLDKDRQVTFKSINVQHLRKPGQSQIFTHKSLSGQGFHRTITYTIQIPKPKDNKPIDINDQQCEVQIIETLPHTTYIDADQLRSHGINVQLQNKGYGDSAFYVNVEKPAYLSKQYQYKLTIPWKQWNQTQINTYSYQLPIHFRYPTPYFLPGNTQTRGTKRTSIEYVEVDVYPMEQAHIVCYPSIPTDISKTTKYLLEQNHLVTKGAALLPVGDGEMKAIVSGVTLISEILCAMLLVRQLRK